MFLVRKVGGHTGEQVHCVPDGGRLCGGGNMKVYGGRDKNVGVGT